MEIFAIYSSKLFQTSTISYSFLMLNTKDILKNVGNQAVYGPH